MANKNGIKHRLTKKEVLSIPKKLPKKTMQEVADEFGVSWQSIWYWVGRLRKSGIAVETRKRGKSPIIL